MVEYFSGVVLFSSGQQVESCSQVPFAFFLCYFFGVPAVIHYLWEAVRGMIYIVLADEI